MKPCHFSIWSIKYSRASHHSQNWFQIQQRTNEKTNHPMWSCSRPCLWPHFYPLMAFPCSLHPHCPSCCGSNLQSMFLSRCFCRILLLALNALSSDNHVNSYPWSEKTSLTISSKAALLVFPYYLSCTIMS